MNIGILGYGKEGKAVEEYFRGRGENDFEIFDGFKGPEEISHKRLSGCDLIFRTPSVPVYWFFPGNWDEVTDEVPAKLVSKLLPENFTSSTKYFFENVKKPVIGVTGTKGKGTTCVIIKAICDVLGIRATVIGNIGEPAISHLDDVETEVFIYEMSSFQLWDLGKSPEVAVVLRIEPDHLNVHKDFDDYVAAKSNIAAYQKPEDTCIYFRDNKYSKEIGALSKAEMKFAYPVSSQRKVLNEILLSLSLRGAHNRENAEAALLAVYSYEKRKDPKKYSNFPKFLSKNRVALKEALKNVKGLPHHLEFVRELNGVTFYDDSCSASSPSLEAAIKAFPDYKIYLIAGGADRGLDLSSEKKVFSDDSTKVFGVFLIGENADRLMEGNNSDRVVKCESLEEAVKQAYENALIMNDYIKTMKTAPRDPSANDSRSDFLNFISTEKSLRPLVLFSPGAPSFDMFKNFYERGEKFQEIVKGLE